MTAPYYAHGWPREGVPISLRLELRGAISALVSELARFETLESSELRGYPLGVSTRLEE